MSSKLNSNPPHRLDDEDNRLYNPKFATRKEKRFDTLFPKKISVTKDWTPVISPADAANNAKRIASHPTFFKKFFIFSIIFAVIAVGISAFTFFTGGNTVSNENIAISIGGNSFTPGGEELPLQVEITNKNPTDLELADLYVAYDKGGGAGGGVQSVNELNPIGTIAAGKTAKKNVYVTLYGGEGTTQNVEFTFQYHIHGSNAIFLKKTTFAVTISSAPIALSVDIPKSVTPNQNLSFTVHVQSNAKANVDGVLLHIDYPSGFKFAYANPVPKAFNNVWNLGTLEPGQKEDIVINGVVYGQDGDDRAFHVAVGSASSADNTVIGLTYNALSQVVSLVKPFISASLAINGSTADVVAVPSASNATVTINWSNNLPTLVTDAQIVVTLSGNAFDPAKISAGGGFFDSTKNTITWDKTNDRSLAAIQPSDHGSESFTFDTPPLVSGAGVLTSPMVNMSVSISGKQPDVGGAVSQVTNFESKKAVISSDLGFSVDAFHNSGTFTNSGPIPPKAGKPTTYTVVWTITNSANTLSGVKASATLPTYVDWLESFYPTNDGLSYDETTRRVTWDMGQVVSGTGFTGASRTMSFQVKLNPSISQIGSILKLILDTNVTARDVFTGESLTTTKSAVSTNLQNDQDFPRDGGIVTN
jgi:hypothetical protein